MIKAYKYRIYPTAKQKVLIEKHFGCCRWIYNYALAKKKTAYETDKKTFSKYDLQRDIAVLKKQEETNWLSEVGVNSLHASIANMDEAYQGFFKKGFGYPKFKHKSAKQSFTARQNITIDFEMSMLSICKLPNIPIILSRGFDGEIRTVTISRTVTGKYYASVLVENDVALPHKAAVNESTTLGIDLGIKNFLTTSTGDKIANGRFLRNDLERLKVLQVRASRKKKGSANRKKANLRVARLHEKITNKRVDFLHKLTYKLTHESQVDTICMETLRVENMLKNHNLAQAISDVSWSKFTELLKYKCDWYGKNLIQIGTFEPSSKTCSNCGTVNKGLKLSHREWQCVKCHATHDRDVNAAKNIKFMGLSGAASPVVPVEPSALVEAVKQEKCATPIKQEAFANPIP